MLKNQTVALMQSLGLSGMVKALEIQSEHPK